MNSFSKNYFLYSVTIHIILIQMTLISLRQTEYHSYLVGSLQQCPNLRVCCSLRSKYVYLTQFQRAKMMTHTHNEMFLC